MDSAVGNCLGLGNPVADHPPEPMEEEKTRPNTAKWRTNVGFFSRRKSPFRGKCAVIMC